MQYFIGIVPPEGYKQKIVNFQMQAFHSELPEMVEPHITIKAQGGLTEDLDWVNRVRHVCTNFPAFQMTIDEPRMFGNAILYLSTDSEEIIELHKQLVETIAPPKELSEKYFELDLYTAHMTLVQTSWGFSEADLVKLKTNAEKELSPFPTFEVNFLRAYHEFEPGRYKPFLDIPLKG